VRDLADLLPDLDPDLLDLDPLPDFPELLDLDPLPDFPELDLDPDFPEPDLEPDLPLEPDLDAAPT